MADHKNTITDSGAANDDAEKDEEEEHAKMSAALARLIGASESYLSSSQYDQPSAAAAAAAAAFDSTNGGGGGVYTTPRRLAASPLAPSSTASSLPPRRLACSCACNWGEQCRRFQQLFTQVGDQEFGGGHLIPLPVSSSFAASTSAGARNMRKRAGTHTSSKKNQVWEEGLRASIGRDNDAHDGTAEGAAAVVDDDSSACWWYVAPHHFDRRQIRWIRAKLQQQKSWAESDNAKHMICRPMELTELSRICDCIDKRFKIKQKSTKKTPKYFNLPNQTMQQVRDEIKRKVLLPHLHTIVASKKQFFQQQQQQQVKLHHQQEQQEQQQEANGVDHGKDFPLVIQPTHHLVPTTAQASVSLAHLQQQQQQEDNVERKQSPIRTSLAPQRKDEVIVVDEQSTDLKEQKQHTESSSPIAAPTEQATRECIPPNVVGVALSYDSLPPPDDDAVLVVPEYAWSFYNACRKGYRRRRWILALHNVQIITFTAATIILAVLYGHYYGSDGGFPSFQNHCQLRTFIATIVLPLYVTIVMISRERFLNKQPNLFPPAFTRTKADIFKFRTRVGPYQTNNSFQCKKVLATRIQDIWKTVREILDDAKLVLPERFWEEDQQVQAKAKDDTQSSSSKPMDEIDLEAQFDEQPTEATPCLAGKDMKTPASAVNSNIIRHGEDDNGYFPLSVEEYMMRRLQKRLERKSSQVKFWQLEQYILNQSITILMFSTSATAILSFQWSIPVLLAVTTAFSTIKKNGRFDNRIAVGTRVMEGLRSAQQQLGMKITSTDLGGSGGNGCKTSWHKLVEEAEEIIVQGEIESFL